MRLFKIFVLLLISGTAFGQSGAAMLMTSAAATGDTYLLDDYPADAAYSLRLLKADQIDSAAIRVRRSSDNAEQDIGFTSEGYLDTASMKTFVGANSGYVVTWYDQSGSEYDAIQVFASLQPRIVNSGIIDRSEGFPTIYFNQDLLAVDFTSGNPVTTFTVVNIPTAQNFKYFLDDFDTPGTNSLNTLTSNQITLLNSTIITASFSFGQTNIVSAISNGGSSYLGINGTYTSGSLSTTSMNGITIGARAGSATFGINGYITEVIVHISDQYSNRVAIDTEINTHYSIY